MNALRWDEDSELADLSQRITQHLLRLRRSVRRRFVWEAIGQILVTVVIMAAASLLLDWWLELSRVGRTAFAIGAGVGALYVAYKSLLLPLRLALAPIELAAAVDMVRKTAPQASLAPRVATVLQLPAQLEQRQGDSVAMIELAVRRSYQSLSDVDFAKALNHQRLWQSLGVALLAVLLPTVYGVLRPDVSRLWAERWLLGSDRPWPRNTRLLVAGLESGRLVVPRGEPVTLQVHVYDTAQPTETVWIRMTPDEGRAETVTMTRFADGDFRHDLPPLQHPVDVRVWGGDGRAEPFQIVPVDRPRIVGLELISKHPRDDEATTHRFTGEEGNVRLLPLTEAQLELTANVPIESLDMDTLNDALRSFQQVDERKFVAQWTHQQTVQMRITLISQDAGLVSLPRSVTIGVKPDRPPRLSLKSSGVRQRVTPSATIPLSTNANDDYGIRSVALHVARPATRTSGDDVRQPDGEPTSDGIEKPAANDNSSDNSSESVEPDVKTESLSEPSPPANDAIPSDVSAAGSQATSLYGPVDPATETAIDREHSLELAELQLVPGDAVSAWTSADDDCFTGSQSAQSRKFVFRIVKPDELFREILLRLQQLRARLRKAADQAESQLNSLPTAALPDDAAALLRIHQLNRREIGEVSRQLDASLVEMRLNRLGGEETYALMNQNVVKPLTRLHDQLMNRQRQALESLTGDEPEPTDTLVERQREIVDALKRILTNMAQWDSFIDVVNQLNAIIQLEERVRQQTEALRKKQVESIFDEKTPP